LRFREGEERGGCVELELGDRPLVAGGAIGYLRRLIGPFNRAGESLLGDRLAVDQDPLPP
jgi:hypothetical protein